MEIKMDMIKIYDFMKKNNLTKTGFCKLCGDIDWSVVYTLKRSNKFQFFGDGENRKATGIKISEMVF